MPANARYIEQELGQLRLDQHAASDPLRAERYAPLSQANCQTASMTASDSCDALAEPEVQLAPAPSALTNAPATPTNDGIKTACSMSAT